MKRLAVILCFLASPALALSEEQTGNVAVDTSATLVPVTTCATCRYLRLQNGGSGVLYCSPDSEVTVNTAVFTVSASEGWVSIPYRTNIYCIASVGQTGTNRDRLYFWSVMD